MFSCFQTQRCAFLVRRFFVFSDLDIISVTPIRL